MNIRAVITGITLTAFGMASADSTQIYELVDSMLSKDPSMEVILQRYRAEWLDVKAENRLEDPEISFDHFWSRPNVGQKMNIGISQSFDWPGLYRDRKTLAERTKTYGDHMAMAETRQREYEVMTALVDVIYRYNALQMMDHVDSLSNASVEAIAEAESKGLLTKVDLGTARLERLAIKRSHRQAHQAYNDAMSALESIVGHCACDAYWLKHAMLSEPGQLPDLSSCVAAASSAPVIQAAAARTSMAEAALKVARNERKPGFSLGYVYNREFGDNFHGVTAGITLPVYSRKSAVTAAQARIAESMSEADAGMRKVEPEIERLHGQLIQLREELAEYDRTLAESNLAGLLREQFESGLITKPEYYQQLTAEGALRADRYDTLYEYHSAMLQLISLCSGSVREMIDSVLTYSE